MRTEVVARAVLKQSWPTAMLCLVIMPVVASAHHAVSAYRSGQLREVEGELVSVAWRNPHISFSVKTTNVGGQEELWILEAGAIYSLQRRGISPDLFQPGDQIRAAGRLHSSEDGRMWLINMLLDDGREVLIHRGSEPRWSFDAIGWVRTDDIQDTVVQNKGLFRVWSEPALRPTTGGGGGAGERRPYREDAPRGPEGAEYSAIVNDFAARCEPMGMPGIMGNPQPFEFVDRGATIELHGFSNNARHVRAIHMSDQANPAEQPASPLGYSVGRWEDRNSLVVQTTRIDWLYANRHPVERSRGELEILERFTLSEDQGSLNYLMSVTDPDVYTRPAVQTTDKTYLALGESMSDVESTNCHR